MLPLGNREGFDFDKESAGLTFEAAEEEAAEVLIKRVRPSLDRSGVVFRVKSMTS